MGSLTMFEHSLVLWWGLLSTGYEHGVWKKEKLGDVVEVWTQLEDGFSFWVRL